jgi:hypothetical protein
LFVRFAVEAETATLYTVAGLASEIQRAASRSRFHSICASGRDVLGSASYLSAVFAHAAPPVPVMLATDGQRPEGVAELGRSVTMIQVTPDLTRGDGGGAIDTAMHTLQRAAGGGYQHALVLGPRADTQDDLVISAVARAHAISAGTVIVIHPPLGEEGAHGRRWATLMERASALHDDVRLMPRLSAPTGMR